MKTDGFGIEHRSTCTSPYWRTLPGGGQVCARCGIRWKPSDPTTPPQPRKGYP